MPIAAKNAWASWWGALMFYTCLPIPQAYGVEFRWISQWVPWVGVVVGGLMALVDWSLWVVHMPVLVRSTLVITFGIALTGGLHLDGVMDTADGLAVPDASKRLEVMADSHMGAFGGIAAVVLIALKVTALAAISEHRLFVLIAVAVCGRWGQQWAIAAYPYLKKEGKGAFHKAALPSRVHALPSLVIMALLGEAVSALGWVPLDLVWRSLFVGVGLALITSAYFNHKLGGHTGDTYGAVVEWSEALLLCFLSCSF
ncbi:MAG: adenosylcobinamide-GDP ribazoletransferase [Cyanobacteria bacterium J06598_3]